MDTLLQDLRYALRTLGRNRGFAAVVVVTLALGIGANTAIFSVVYGVLARPLPYADAERLIWTRGSLPDLQDLRDEAPSLAHMGIYATNLYDLSGAGAPGEVRGLVVTPELFPVLGVRPALGRLFEPSDDSHPLAVVSDAFWRERLGADGGALGRTILLGRRPHTIVGVMPRGFVFPSADYTLWTTFGSALAETPAQASNRGLRIFRGVARLGPDASLARARQEADVVSRRLAQRHPDTNEGVAMTVVPIRERLVGDARPALLVLFASVALVLLIACANVAGLLLARMPGREQEMSIRTALGASRPRLVRQLLTESLVLSGLGGLIGLVLAGWCVELLPRIAPDALPRLEAIRLDGPVLAFTLGTSALAGLLFGLAPALQTGRSRALGDSSRGASAGVRVKRARQVVVAAEVALAVVLLVGAGLLARSLVGLTRVDGGFVADRAVTLMIKGAQRYSSERERALVFARILEQIRALPGVQSAGGATSLPPDVLQRRTGFAVEGRHISEPAAREADFVVASEGFFEALGTPVVSGRVFHERDTVEAPKVAIINRSLASRLFAGEDAVGRRIRLVNPEQDPGWRTIVGVVADVRYSGLENAPESQVYTPLAQTPSLWMYVVVRSRGEPASVAASLPAAVARIDPEMAPVAVTALEQRVADSLGQPRFNALLLSAFAGLALLLAAVGIYGVIAYAVAQRTREIGIRMALGARRSAVVALVLRDGLRPVLVGAAIGAAAAAAAARFVSGLLFGITPTDPLTFASACALLLAVAAVAAIRPARNASSLDPAAALRHD